MIIIYFFYFIKLLTTIMLLYINNLFKYDVKWLYSILYDDIILNGCLTIKFTQWFVSRLNIIFDEFPKDANKFENLLDNCPTHSFKYTKYSFYKSFKINIEDIFYDINKIPIASGSVGQVYSARFKHNNKKVAIKVKHPNVNSEILFPKYFILFFSFLLTKFPILYGNIIPIDFNDFFENFDKQLDFNIEYKNMNILRDNYKDNYLIIIPETYFSSKDFLIMSYEDGESFNNLIIEDYKKYKIALTLILIIRQGFLIDNFIHADLHNGNWKVRKYKDEYQLILFDTGLCFSSKSLQLNRAFIKAWEINDYKTISTITMKLLDYKKADYNYIEQKLKNELKQLLKTPLTISIIIKTTVNLIQKNNLIINGSYLNLVITLAMTENIFRTYGITPDENSSYTLHDIYNIAYVDNINFCDTKKVFVKLSTYLKEIVNAKFKKSIYRI